MTNARPAPVRHDVPPTEVTMLDARAAEGANFATRFVKRIAPRATPSAKPAGSVTIGRASDNDIVIPDVLASRYHATLTLTPLGTEIRDTSVNGTFVNGTRVGSAILSEGDVVTVGNIDLVVSGGLLVRRSETEAATRTGGLEVRNVQYVVENGKQLLSDISLTARPGTLTAVIGGSGAGKEHTGPLDRRLHHAQLRVGDVRGPRHSRRIRLAAQQNRHGSTGRRRAPAADGQPGAELCRRTAPAARHQQSRPDQGRLAGARGTRPDQARQHAGRQAVRRTAQARLGGARAAHRAVAADAR